MFTVKMLIKFLATQIIFGGSVARFCIEVKCRGTYSVACGLVDAENSFQYKNSCM